jgi:predicted SnoaL-like aldol condensation-catalyzing enzyme
MNITANKENAVAFYDLMFNRCEPAKAIEKFVGDVYIQHNPHVGDGKQAFVEYLNVWQRNIPAKK